MFNDNIKGSKFFFFREINIDLSNLIGNNFIKGFLIKTEHPSKC